MLNKLLIGAALTLALAACASTPPSPDAAKSTVANTQPPGCAGSSAIPASQTASPQPCAGFGSVYTKTEMDRMGATSAGDALRLLAPTVSVSRP